MEGKAMVSTSSPCIFGVPWLKSSYQAAEERITHSSTKEEALKNAILATEIYMKAIKLASSAAERDKLKAKCMRVLARAEEIKQMKNWSLPVNQDGMVTRGRRLKTPSSLRALSTREEVILLESSKLHGFIFPPWQSDPTEEFFDMVGNGEYYTYVFILCMCVLLA
jgi:calpain-7